MNFLLFVVFNLFTISYGHRVLHYWVYYIRCGPNEYIPECLPCPAPTCGGTNETITCPKKCYPNKGVCQCLEGYLRNAEGICVKAPECACGENEHIPECVPCGPWNCGEKENKLCATVCQKNKECYCKPGFLRNKQGVCVKKDECACGENEHIPICVPCPPLKCDNNITVCTEECILNYECHCKPGFLKNEEGVCVEEKQCACGQNEHIPECAPCYDLTCDDRDNSVCNTLLCQKTTKCYCKPGFFRNKQGICVKKDECDCGENEHIPICVPCPPLKCGNNNTFCTSQCIFNNECHCKPGFLRNKEGVCVKEKECACGKNEYIPECAPCYDLTCQDPDDTVCNTLLCQNTTDCYCLPGYRRNSQGICVTREECACGENEEIPECIPCQEPNCGDEDIVCPTICELNKYKQCFCKPGFQRNKQGVCVSKEECACGENEDIPECIPCQESRCGEKDKLCPAICELNKNQQCYCKPGFKRNEYGVCVSQEECACGKNEEIPECIPCQDPNCGDEDLVCPEICKPNKIGTCYCKPGFQRNKQGVCVSKEECACGENEEIPICIPCQAVNCGEEDPFCIAICRPNERKQCFCKPGFQRNKQGVCVSKEECACGENEQIPECIPCQDPTCGDEDLACPAICRLNEIRKCYCKPGFQRNKQGICVSKEECACGENEQIPECLPCQALNCGDEDPVCLAICEPNKYKQCFCKPGFQRNKQGVCVSKEECACGENEQIPECLPCQEPNCGDEDIVCPAICELNKYKQCFCKPGFQRNKQGVCVSKEECACGENEHIPECIPCRGLNCGDEDPVCIAICELNKYRQCFCKPGFQRNNQGVCVTKEECACGENEYIPACVPCPLNCGDNTTCSRECQENKICQCKQGFLRNKQGVCVKKEECACGENEYIPGCVPCPPLNCGDKANSICTLECLLNDKCYCKPGFLRNKEGVCVKTEECACGENEHIPQCVPCPLNCGDNTTCTKECQLNKKCQCKPGFLKNKQGFCVQEKECACGENEFIPPCIPCSPVNCGDSSDIYCPAACFDNDKCYCKKGFLRNKRGVCIDENTCPRDGYKGDGDKRKVYY